MNWQLANLLLGTAGSIGQSLQGYKAAQEEEKRFGEMKDLAQGLLDTQPAAYRELNLGADGKGGTLGEYQSLVDLANRIALNRQVGTMRDFGRARSNMLMGARGDENAVMRQYQQRYDTGMGMLKGLGDQEKADLAQRTTNANSAATGQLARAGLGNTTLGASIASGNLRRQGDEAARINERLQSQALNTHAMLGGDLASANERSVGRYGSLRNSLEQAKFDLGRELQGNVDVARLGGLETMAQQRERLTKEPLALTSQFTGNLIDVLGNRQGPLQWVSPFLGMQQSIQPMLYQSMQPKESSGGSLFGGLAGGTGGAIGGSILATALMPELSPLMATAAIGGAVAGGVGGGYAGYKLL
jgi:hypothetical protein